MRLFVLSLLALSAHARSVGYRTNLLSYTPQGGVYAVNNGLAQGYVRYFDANGAERLVPYNYPETQFGLQRLSLSNIGSAAPLIRAGTVSEPAQDQTELFRAWCEQRYNALKLEIDQLRAEGQKPSANMLAQFEPLEKIIKTGAYDAAMSGLSPEVQRAREEELRLWYEARQNVLRAEEEHIKLSRGELRPQAGLNLNSELRPQIDFSPQAQFSDAALKPQTDLKRNGAELKPQTALRPQAEMKPQFDMFQLSESNPFLSKRAQFSDNEAQGAPQQVEEDTSEVMDSDEEQVKLLKEEQPQPVQAQTSKEGLKQLSDSLKPKKSGLRIKSTQVIVNTPASDSFGSPKPVEDTEEVKRAREEHLRLFELAKLKAESAIPVANEGENENASDENLFELSVQEPALKTMPGIPNQQQKAQPSGLKSTFNTPGYQPGIKQPAVLNMVQDTPEVQRAREEHLRLVNEAKRKLEDRAEDDADRIKLLVAENERLKERDNELRFKEEQLREEELKKEMERQKEEQRLLEAERIALQVQEQRRLEKEAIEQAERLKIEEAQRLQDSEAQRLKLAEAASQTRRQPDIQSDISPQTLLQLQPQIQPQLQSQIQPQMKPQLQSQLQPQIQQELQPQIQPQLQLQFQSQIQPQSQQQVELQIQSQPQLKTQPQTQTQQTQTEAQNLPQLESLGKRADFKQNQAQQFLPLSVQLIQDNNRPLQQQQQLGKQSSYYLRIPAQISNGGAYIIGGESQPQYIISGTQTNPQLVRYAQDAPPTGASGYRPYGAMLEKRIDEEPVQLQALSLFSEPIGKPIESITSSKSPLKISYSGSSSDSGLSELERATREHFRAHEIALEQLRIANEKDNWKSNACNRS